MKKLVPQLIVLCFVFLFANSVAKAQSTPASITVQGRVLDKDRKPLQNVTVAEVDRDQRTVRAVRSDVEGHFAF